MVQRSSFISQRFEKPKKRHSYYPIASLDSEKLPIQQQSKGVTQMPSITSSEFSYESLALVDSARKGMTVDEWKRADAIIKTQAAVCKFKPGDHFYPPDFKGYVEYGECVVIGVDRDLKSINNFNDLVWTEDGRTPYIVHARTCEGKDDGRSMFFTCTVGYLCEKPPEVKQIESEQPSC